jgi:tetratricopeptide (TPR) repeat protein
MCANMWFVGFDHPQTPVCGFVGPELRPNDPGQLFALIDATGSPPPLRDRVIVASRSAHSAAIFAFGDEAGSIAMFSEMMQLAAEDIVGDTAHEIELARYERPARLSPVASVKGLPEQYMALRFPTDARDWSTMPLNRRVRALWGIHERERAIALLEAGCRTSQDAVDHFHLGELLAIELNRPGDAIPHLRKATQLAPDRTEPFTTLSIALTMVGDAAGAIDAALTVTQRAPNDAAAWANLATAYESKGDVERMRAAAKRAQQLEPGEPLTAALLAKR